MAQPNGAPGNNVLIRPDQINTLPFLDENKKATYKQGLANLWRQYESNPVGSQERSNAELRIRQASQKIMQDISKANRPNSGGGPHPQGPTQQRPPTQGGQQPGMPQQHANPGQGVAPSQPAQPATNQIPPSVRQQLDSITIHVPHNLPPQQHSGYKAKWYQQAATQLIARERLVAGGRHLQQRIQQARTAGQEVPQQLQTQFEGAKRQLQEIDGKWSAMRNNNEQNGRANAAAMQQPAGNQNAQPAQPSNMQQSQPQNGSQPQEISRAPTQDPKSEQRVAVSPAQSQGGFQHQAATAQTPQTTNMPPQQHPQSATQLQTGQTFPPNAAAPLSNQRPSMNPQMPQQPGSQHVQPSGPPMQHPGAATVAATQNNAAQQNQRPQPLSQQAAMAQAAEQYARGQAHGQVGAGQQQQTQQPAMSNNIPFAQPGAGGQNTPNSAYPPPHQMQATQQPPTNKFPIGKTVQLDPRTQNPVAGPPARPTLANQGVLSQPGLTRPQPFTLEGEGDRVLSKRKLDELVRQVTGAADASPEAGGLAPDVEEAVLSLADDFVDNVITSACRLAKLRSGQTLDIKDVQMVLERNYGIRIPGYSLDEVRTVRKFQPAPGWQSKMQAIQTAKTLGGVSKTDT